MVGDRGDIEDALGRSVRELAVPETGRVAYAIDVEVDEIVPVWRLAGAYVERFGRWPVAVTGWEPEPVNEDIFALGWPDGHTPEALCEQARSTLPTSALSSFRDDHDWWQGERWTEWIELQLKATQRRIGAVPAVADVLAAVRPASVAALERWLLAWEEERRPTTHPDAGDHLCWVEPSPYDGVAIVLLPTVASEDVGVFVPCLEGVRTADQRVALAAVLQSWGERFGAEIVAAWGTMLQFVLTRPPVTLDEALDLAFEHDRVAPSTLPLPGVAIRDHARALLHRDTWFLHDRP